MKSTVSGNEQDIQIDINPASTVITIASKLRTESAPLPKFSVDVSQCFSFERDFTYLVEGQRTRRRPRIYSEIAWDQNQLSGSREKFNIQRRGNLWIGTTVRLTSDALIGQISKFKPLASEYDVRLADSYHLVKKMANIFNDRKILRTLQLLAKSRKSFI